MATSSALKNPATYHLLSYGTLLGSTLFQSFISGIVAYRCLPRAQFSTLQRHTFPVFFALQTTTSLAMLLTYPRGSSVLLSSLSLVSSLSSSSTLRVSSDDRLTAYLIVTMFVTGLGNWVWIGPLTTKVMGLRKHQETRDGKKSHDTGPHSKEMEALNKRFGMLHGMSTIVNLIGFGAMIWYAGVLAQYLSL